jgi:hypothetical protein
MARAKGIIAYGSEDDRRKLEVLAAVSKRSSSQHLIEMIRAAYTELYGDAAPEAVLGVKPWTSHEER